MKTDIEICKDIYRIVTESSIRASITGIVSYTGRDTDMEDCVISVLDSLSGQIQTAKVNVNVYVPDRMSNGRMRADVARIGYLSSLCSDVFGEGKRSLFGDGIRVTLEKQRVLSVNGKDEHVINNLISYKFNNE